MNPTMTEADARAALVRVRVKAGLIGQEQRAGPFKLGLRYDRDESAFLASCRLTVNGKEGRMRLEVSDVETRGRSMWLADNTWRLTSAGIERVLASLRDIGAIAEG
jgi:hypothetical protein